jgi:hypothetical protein
MDVTFVWKHHDQLTGQVFSVAPRFKKSESAEYLRPLVLLELQQGGIRARGLLHEKFQQVSNEIWEYLPYCRDWEARCLDIALGRQSMSNPFTNLLFPETLIQLVPIQYLVDAHASYILPPIIQRPQPPVLIALPPALAIGQQTHFMANMQAPPAAAPLLIPEIWSQVHVQHQPATAKPQEEAFKPRKRGRPAGSKDFVQRVRRFTKRAHKPSQTSSSGASNTSGTSTAKTSNAEAHAQKQGQREAFHRDDTNTSPLQKPQGGQGNLCDAQSPTIS